ncbi:MAG: serine/threonine-protein phosphatase [Gammaproteobacteria bacterium]
MQSGQFVIYTHRSPSKETENEDCLAVIPLRDDCYIFAVADGLGGLPSGGSASQITIDTLDNKSHEYNEGIQFREIILDSFEKANRLILDKGSGAATTLAVAELQKNEVRTYHVGDSKILVCGQRGKIKLNTVSHSPVEYAVEAGVIDEDEAVLHDERHLVSNVVGSHEMSITLGSTVKLSKYDTLLLASDGLFDNLYMEEIIEIIRKGPLESVATSLIEMASKRMLSEAPELPGHPDDLTFILYRPL